MLIGILSIVSILCSMDRVTIFYIIVIIIIIIIIISSSFESFSRQFQLWSFHRNLSDSQMLQVSRTPLGILTDLIKVVVRMVSTCPLISMSSGLFYQSFGDCSNRINFNWYPCHQIFHCVLSSRARSTYLSLISLSFNFTLWCAGTIKFTILQGFFVDYH